MTADLFDWQPPAPADFQGGTFDAARDGRRLNAQCQRVFNLMRDGGWRGLADISNATGDPEASISARLRDLRRRGFDVQRRYVKDGLWHYRLRIPVPAAGGSR